ncbi:unnamed protein product [Miscanthus lutarioriparius]|uniref:HECT-type E3 ubiquitin transferase n=1 Tax=Miscanthus lutarioriparius TaxID=422564 RepID=A0A811QD11_9POAL|nr:unnamed protein product [Miscanthus lutarioriparius]
MELCEALSFCAEDTGGYFPTEAAARALVRRAGGGGGDGTGATPNCLQAFEKISRRQPTQCLQAGMINAVLAYVDFFAASIKRVAVSAVANACKKVPADCSQFVLDSVPTLCNLLQSEDKMIVEKVAACLISIVDSFSTSVDLVDQLCHQGVIEKVLPLIHTGGLTALSPSTCSNLIGLC